MAKAKFYYQHCGTTEARALIRTCSSSETLNPTLRKKREGWGAQPTANCQKPGPPSCPKQTKPNPDGVESARALDANRDRPRNLSAGIRRRTFLIPLTRS